MLLTMRSFSLALSSISLRIASSSCFRCSSSRKRFSSACRNSRSRLNASTWNLRNISYQTQILYSHVFRHPKKIDLMCKTNQTLSLISFVIMRVSSSGICCCSIICCTTSSALSVSMSKANCNPSFSLKRYCFRFFSSNTLSCIWI